MKAYSEKTHAKQVDNFRDLVNFVRAYGLIYNPSKYDLKLPQLETLLLNAQIALNNVTRDKSFYEDIINKRALAFANFRILSTRLVNALQSTDASPMKIKHAKSYHRKIQGKRAKPIDNIPTSLAIQTNAIDAAAMSLPPYTPNITDTTTDTHPYNTSEANITIDNIHSVAQLSYTQLLQHFSGLIAVLKTEATYMPNEVDLQLSTLEAMKDDLASKNDAVSTAIVTLSNARLTRDNTLYNNTNSIYQVSKEIKKYIKSIYTASDAIYMQIRALYFKPK